MDRLLLERGTPPWAHGAALADAYGAVREETGVLPFDGAERLLLDLRRRYRLGLLTNGPSDIQWEKIRSLNFADRFDAILVAGDVRIFKPDVRVFRILLDRLDTPAHASLFVGDAYGMDILGAHNAGMRTAWVTQGGTCPVGDVIPDVKIDDIGALREVLL